MCKGLGQRGDEKRDNRGDEEDSCERAEAGHRPGGKRFFGIAVPDALAHRAFDADGEQEIRQDDCRCDCNPPSCREASIEQGKDRGEAGCAEYVWGTACGNGALLWGEVLANVIAQ